MRRRETVPRPATTIDQLAAFAANVLPRALAPAIDRLRLDVGTVLGDLRGDRTAPFADDAHPFRPPMPLAAIDPIAPLVPRFARARYQSLRRDARAVTDALAGRVPSPTIYERPTASNPRNDLLAPRSVHVEAVVRETDDAVSLVLTDRAGAPFDAIAGQFFTVLVDVGGVTHRRAYSVSSDVRDRSRVRITAKRVRDGRVSNHLNDHVRAGDTLRVLGPSGHFTLAPDASRAAHYVLIAGGSGITPMMSIARAALHGEPDSRATLLFGNRSERDAIFRAEIDTLAAEHAGRFTVRHVFETGTDDSSHGRGRLDRDTVSRELAMLVTDASAAVFYLCGPEPMMHAAREAALALGADAGNVREERFANPAARIDPIASLRNDSRAQRVSFRIAKGAPREVIVAAEQTVLEAGLGAGLAMPYSCAMGGCGACRVMRVEGEIEMEEPNCLSEKERAAGYVLACVSRAKSPCTVEVPA